LKLATIHSPSAPLTRDISLKGEFALSQGFQHIAQSPKLIAILKKRIQQLTIINIRMIPITIGTDGTVFTALHFRCFPMPEKKPKN
jgi:hypothetical protein